MKANEMETEGTILGFQQSDTDPKKDYAIRWSREKGYSCECTGFISSKKRPKTCKHIKRLCFEFEIELLVLTYDGKEPLHKTTRKITESAIKIWGV